MAEDSLRLPTDQNLDFHIITLFDRLEMIRKETLGLKYSNPLRPKFNMQLEIRTLEFWRSIISECLSSFFYVFIVCGAAAGAGVGASVSSVLLSTALASGFAITALTQSFLHISGANINPAVTIGLAIARKISPLRSAMYITAQCGGGIAGAALLYGVTVPGYQGNLQTVISHSSTLPTWERFGVEFILTFIVVFTYFVSTDSNCRHFGSSSFTIGAAYSACSFVSMPYLNPARSLGPSFVLNKWENHWVYWLGPLAGGAVSGFAYEYIFNPKRHTSRKSKRNSDNDVSSLQSEDDLNYDLDIEKTQGTQKIHVSSNYNTYKSTTGTLNPQQQQQPQGYCQSLYSGPPMNTKIDRVESLYGGTRSLYCKSPPLTRANLNRSQSVYAKSQTAINRDLSGPLRPGPLVPAQSLYPMRLVSTLQSSHAQNQNVQNQMQQRSESIYGIRGSMRQSQQQQQPLPPPPPSNDRMPENQAFQPIYGSRTNPNDGLKYDRDDAMKYNRINRPDSMYGMTGQRRGQSQSAQSDDSSYGSYHGPNSAITPTGRTAGNQNGDLQLPPPNYNSVSNRNQQNERKISSSNSNGNTNIPNSNSNSNSNTNSGHPPPPPPPLSTNPPNGIIYGPKTSTPQINSLPQHPHQYGMHPIRQN